MGSKLLRDPTRYFSRDEFHIFDDFNEYVKGDKWTDVQSDATSTVTIPDGNPSCIQILTSADNESATLATTVEQFKFLDGKEQQFETRLLFTDAASATKNACFLWGVMDAIQLDRAVDGGQSIVINDSGAIIWKKSEGSAWIFETNVAGGTQVQTVSTLAPQSTAYQTLRIDCLPISSTEFVARPFVDGVQLVDANNVPIAHTTAVASAVAMDFGLELKGGHADDTTVLVDYLYGAQMR